MIAARRDFNDCDALASTLARDITDRLGSALARRERALIALSGGTTPRHLFARLSREPVAWPRVTVTLVDERCVPESSDRSNAKLVRMLLLNDRAAEAKFVPLFDNEPAAAELEHFDVVVLGMGADGHTASFFPGGDRLTEVLDMNGSARIVRIEAPGVDEPRLTRSLSALLDSDFIALHIEGEGKSEALARALAPGPVEDMPIRAFLNAPEPVIVYWSP